MNVSPAIVWLAALVGVLAAFAAGVGLLWGGGDGAYTYTTHRGQLITIYGQGLYRNDSLFMGALNQGTDMTMLVLGLPLLFISTLWYWRGSLRGALLLLGTLIYVVYCGATYAMGNVAYNELFLVYVALFAASFWTTVLLFRSIDQAALAARFSDRMPRRSIGIFMLMSGAVTLLVWLLDPLTTLVAGTLPAHLDTYTTLFTHAFDMAIIVPAVFICGTLILRGNPLGYVMALMLLVLEAMLAPMIIAQTVSQLRAGVTMTTAEIVGPIGGFVTIAVIAIWFLISLLRNIADLARLRAAYA